MDDIHTYRWKNRLILLFSPSSSYPSLLQQQQLMDANTAALNTRDLLVFSLPFESAENSETQEYQLKLRQQFQVTANSFAIILIGKDGTEKLRRYTPIVPEEIFALIDTMPMRQREMKSQR